LLARSCRGIQRAGVQLPSEYAFFLSFFGVDPVVVVRAWDMIQVPFFHDGDLSHAQPKHILWALLFLKKYGDESEMAALCGEDGRAVDEKTFRKWCSIFVCYIASLKQDVVSSAHCFFCFFVIALLIRLIASLFSSCCRSCGRTERSATKVMTV